MELMPLGFGEGYLGLRKQSGSDSPVSSRFILTTYRDRHHLRVRLLVSSTLNQSLPQIGANRIRMRTYERCTPGGGTNTFHPLLRVPARITRHSAWARTLPMRSPPVGAFPSRRRGRDTRARSIFTSDGVKLNSDFTTSSF